MTRDPDGLTELKLYLEPAGFAMVNLETAVTKAVDPTPSKSFTFRAPNSGMETLGGAAIDAASMANNHTATTVPRGSPILCA